MTFALEIAARTVWQEARGEPEEGQRAVAHVIVNRLRDGRWGKSLASVCLADRQFSGWNNSDPNRIAACTLPDDNASLARFREFLTEAMTAQALIRLRAHVGITTRTLSRNQHGIRGKPSCRSARIGSSGMTINRSW
jgi:hypothetical protein